MSNEQVTIAVQDVDVESAQVKGKEGKEGEEPEVPTVPLTSIMAYGKDRYGLLYLGLFVSVLNGTVMPAFCIILGEIFNVFLRPAGEMEALINQYVLGFVLVGVAACLMSYLSNASLIVFGEHTVSELRRQYFDALLRQEVGFYDEQESGTLISRMNSDITTIQNGISEKLGTFVTQLAQLVVSIGIAFYYSWDMTLVLLGVSPVLVITGALQAKIFEGTTQAIQESWGRAGQVVSEVLGNVRTVYAFTAEDHERTRFQNELDSVYEQAKKRAHSTGFGNGISFAMIFFVYALGFWYGGLAVREGSIEPGDILIVFFAIVIGASGLGQFSSVIPDILKARVSGAAIFAVIAREPLIDVDSKEGVKADNLEGNVVFDDVRFAYPTRKDNIVMENFSLDVRAGMTVALVGPSGSGKSTTISLLQRFYEPLSGSIKIDGTEVSDYNLRSLRQQMGVVSQEPVLFSGTIMQNIKYGRRDATDEEVVQAAREANIHNDIQGFKEGYNTPCGERGAQLSGGQKQRICIARALLRNPKMILLDEATSALDAESEGVVQEALERLMKGRTTFVIAHRLSTIRDADLILVIDQGRIVEQGTHQQLMDLSGVYGALVARQLSGGNSNDDDDGLEEKKDV